jgi:uncharacterized protein (TIGR03437 family)
MNRLPTVRSIGLWIAMLLSTFASFAFAGTAPSLQTHYIRLGTRDTSAGIAADPSGNIFVVSQTVVSQTQVGIRVTKADPSGNVIAFIDFGQGVTPYAAAVDAQGNLFVVGNRLIAKLDNGLTSVIATTAIPGRANAVTTDGSGNVYITGSAGSDFPTTPGAYQADSRAGALYGFVAEFSNDLATLLSATLFGNYFADCLPNRSTCGSPTSPAAPPSATTPTSIALDSSGSVVIAGYTNQQPAPLGAQPYNYGFAAKFSADLTTLQTQAVFNPVGSSAGQVYFRAMALDAQGNIWLAGDGNNVGPLPASGLQPVAPASTAGFVLKVDSGLQSVLWGTYFGAEYLGARGVEGIAIDGSGNVWLTGFSRGSYLPNPIDTGLDSLPFVAELAPDGSSILNLVSSQFGGAAVASTPSGGVAVLGTTDSFLLTASPDQPSLLMIANSANNQSTGTIAPAELISLYGTGIGPDSPFGGTVVDGAFTTNLGDCQVLFNGQPAPLLYAGPNQINVVAPAAIAGQDRVDIQVVGPRRTTAFPAVFEDDARPQFFSAERTYVPQFTTVTEIANYAIAFNQDGSLNTESNPATKGSVVTVWVSGAGLSDYSLRDGAIANSAATSNLPISVLADNGTAMEVLYAAQAPGAVQGLTQINFRVPSDSIAVGPFQFWIYLQQGASTSRLAAIEVLINQ